MKYALTILLLITFSVSNATIRRVNNNSGVTPVDGLVYADFISAFNDAANGDTIYIEPSINHYTPPNPFNKRLTIIGDGYLKGTNATLQNPLSFSLNESILQGNFTIAAGAENTAFYGVHFRSSSITLTAGNILFKRCRLKGFNAQTLTINSSSNLIEQCYFDLDGGGHNDIAGNGSGNIFRNCIMTDVFRDQQNPIVDQCILGGVSNVVNGTFTNSIVGTNTYTVGTNSTFTNSIKIGATFGTPGNNNIENASVNDIFILGGDSDNDPFDTSIDRDFRLKVGSIAAAAGNTGQDIGPFGGSVPYRLSGMPPVPIISNFFLSSTGSTSSGLTGSITIQSNN